MKQGDGVSNWSHFSPQMSSHEDLNEAKEAMKKAQKEYDEAKGRFTSGWKKRNGEELTDTLSDQHGTLVSINKYIIIFLLIQSR
jgi:hypothetical protein